MWRVPSVSLSCEVRRQGPRRVSYLHVSSLSRVICPTAPLRVSGALLLHSRADTGREIAPGEEILAGGGQSAGLTALTAFKV